MKILAPVSNYPSAVNQIDAGADEIYLGLHDEFFANLSFSGRGKYNPQGLQVNPNYPEFKEIVEYAHARGVTVMFTANLPFLADDPNGGTKMADCFLHYVDKGLQAGVDSIVVGDLGAILLLQKRGIQTHFTASTFLEAVNAEQIQMMREFGLKRVVLSYQMTLAEIEELAALNLLELEVFGHYGCSFYDGYCNLKHFFGESKEMGIGVPCQGLYRLYEGDRLMAEGNIFNASLVCSICSLTRLQKAGVYALKMVGRAQDMDQNVLITSIYRQFLNRLDEENLADLREELLPRWWTQGLCRLQLCKYGENPITNSFVGRRPQERGE